MAKLGITTDIVASGPLKDQPNPTHPLSAQGREELNRVVLDLYEQFVTIVANGRHMAPDQVRALADGRVFTGRQAKEAGLVDELGDETAARAWLAANAGIPVSLRAQELRTRSRAQAMLTESLAPIADMLKTVLYQGVGLDVAQALWQPSVPE
jgi:protease-4